MKALLLYLALCSAAQAADVSVERIYWLPNDGGREVAIKYGGGMKRGDIQKLGDALRAAKADGKVVTTLWMDSWGGDGDTGLLVAGWASNLRINVFVDEHCLSACAYTALVALGHGRLLVTDGALIGVHQAKDDTTGKADVAWTRATAEKLRRYGAPRAPLQDMCEQPPEGMRLIGMSTLAALGAQVMKQPFKWSWW